MKKDSFELSIAVPSPRGLTKIPEYGLNGVSYIEGRRDQKYVIKLRNDSARRVLALVSVDGLSVLDGEPCTPQSRGYILPAYSSTDIEGWRTNLSEVREFSFQPKEKSYAGGTATGDTKNCGVVAVKFFSEKVKPISTYTPPPPSIREDHHHHHHHHYPPINVPPQPTWPTVPNQPFWFGTPTCVGATSGQMMCANNSLSQLESPGCSISPTDSSQVPEFALGTGWGAAKISMVSAATFDRDVELCTLELYYAEAATLEKSGVALVKKVAVTPPATPGLPQAFSGFCKPPVSR